MHTNTITGKTAFEVYNQEDKIVECKPLSSDPSRCFFASTGDATFRIIVESRRREEAVFTIVYTIGNLECLPGQLNRPLHLSLPPNSTQCRLFTLKKPTYLHVSNSLTVQQVLSPLLSVNISANDHQLYALRRSSRIILPSELAPYCPLTDNRAEYSPECVLQLHINNSASIPEEVSLIFSQQQEETMLFEGIPGRV